MTLNLIKKITYVFAALLLFDLVTSYFFVWQVWYWLGIVASAVIIGYYFDRLEDNG